jgi:hypothetical protein
VPAPPAPVRPLPPPLPTSSPPVAFACARACLLSRLLPRLLPRQDSCIRLSRSWSLRAHVRNVSAIPAALACRACEPALCRAGRPTSACGCARMARPRLRAVGKHPPYQRARSFRLLSSLPPGLWPCAEPGARPWSLARPGPVWTACCRRAAGGECGGDMMGPCACVGTWARGGRWGRTRS